MKNFVEFVVGGGSVVVVVVVVVVICSLLQGITSFISGEINPTLLTNTPNNPLKALSNLSLSLSFSSSPIPPSVPSPFFISSWTRAEKEGERKKE